MVELGFLWILDGFLDFSAILGLAGIWELEWVAVEGLSC